MTNDDNYGPWIDWKGGECPIPDAEAWTFELRFRGGEETPSTIAAKKWIWANDKPTSADITAYRVRLPADDLLRRAIEALRKMDEAMRGEIDTRQGRMDCTIALVATRAVLASAAERGL